MIPSGELIGTRLHGSVKRAENANRDCLAAALGNKLTDTSIEALLDKFEGDLRLFAFRVGGDTGFVLNDPRVVIKRVSSALAAVTKAADALRHLNQFERHALKQLIHYHLDPDYCGQPPSLEAVLEALEVLLKIDLKSAQIKNPKSVFPHRKMPSKGNKAKNKAYRELADATLELWRQAGRKIDRSGKSGGVLHLTGLLVSCFKISIVAFAKFDASGEKQEVSRQRAVFEENTTSVAQTLPKYLGQAIQAAQKRRFP